jgi:hypothetical protein
MGWRARERWLCEKEDAAGAAARLLLEPSRAQVLLPHLYGALGGTAQATSPLSLKGGAAFVLFMRQAVAFHGEALPPSVCSFADVADLDFTCQDPADALVPRAAMALPWLAAFSQGLWPRFQESCTALDVRRDAACGEAFFDGRRFQLGASPCAGLPIKCSFHGGLVDRHTGEPFQLVRLGAAVWHRRLRRSAIAPFVDISVGSTRAHPTVCVMGIRVQAPRSMLKALRRMAFHELGYEPWTASGNEAKQARRLERLIKLGFVLDWKTMGGPAGNKSAARGLQSRWQKALDFLCTANAAALRDLAASAPPQMRFTLSCFARALERALAGGTLEALYAWIDSAVLILLLDVCGDLTHDPR